jgi:hypothetical protein
MCVYNCKHGVLFIDIDECINNPCMNGGTCNNMPGYYECICPVGWYGSKCEMGKSPFIWSIASIWIAEMLLELCLVICIVTHSYFRQYIEHMNDIQKCHS